MTPDQNSIDPTTVVDPATATAEAPGATPTPGRCLQLARDAFSISQSWFDSSVRTQITNDIRQANSIHPSGSKYHNPEYRLRSRLFRPKTRTTIRKNEASAAEAFFGTRDLVEVTAEDDSDEMNVAASKYMGELLSYTLKKRIPWFLTCMGAYQDAQVTGVVCSMQEWQYDPRKKPNPIDRPKVTLIPVENLRLDPACDWTDPINTSPYLIHQMPMYVKDVKARSRTNAAVEGPWARLTDAQLLVAANRQMDTIRAVRENKRQDSKAQSSAITDYTIVWVHRNIFEIDGNDWVFYTLGDSLMLSTPVPIEDVYWHGMRPYAMGGMAIEAHKLYASGIPRMTADLQSEINEFANGRQDNIRFAMSKRWFVKRNSQVDLRSLMRNTPGSSTLMNDVEKDVKVVDTPDVTASSFKEQDLLNVDFDDMAGTFSQATVQTQRNLNETVGGLELMDEKANQVGNYQLLIFATTWMIPVLRQINALLAHYESDQRILVMCAKSVGLDEMGIDAITDELMMADLIVAVNAGQGATSPSARMANLTNAMGTIRNTLADGLLENHGLKTQDFFSEVLGIAGYKDAEKFFSTEIDPTVQALQKQVQDLTAQLGQKGDPPELTAAKVELSKAQTQKAKNDAVVSGVTAAFEAIQGANLIAVTPAVGPIADMIMKAAGYTPPAPLGVDPDLAGNALPSLPAPVPGVEPPADSGSTDPSRPSTGAVGAQQGIETPRND